MNAFLTKRVILLCLGLSLSVTACTQTTAPSPAAMVMSHPTTATQTPTFTPLPIPSLTATRVPVPMDAFQQGVSYGSWWHGEYSSPDSDQTLAQIIQPMGVNWLSVIVTCYQDQVTSAAIRCEPQAGTPTDDDLRHVIQTAHSLGLRVMLKPHVDLASDVNHWRGQIDFGQNEAAWQAWFRSYSAFLSHYAVLAQETGADYFVVGTELQGTSRRSAEWREVIRMVRGIYSGPLTYASNHDGEEAGIDWWDALDAIGVDAYYPLTQSDRPTVAQLKAAWAPVATRLGKLSKRWGKPVIFTEVGYQSLDGTNQTPWNVDGPAIDLQEQADCYQALFEALAGQRWWHGVFWWAWDTNPSQGGPTDGGFSGNNKPAEEVLRRDYGAPPRPTPTATPALAVDESSQLVIYQDAPGPGWEDWSWDADVSLESARQVHYGGRAVRVALKPWGTLSLHHAGIDTSPYYWLEFYINLGSETQRRIVVYFNNQADVELVRRVDIADPTYLDGGAFAANRWQRVRIPLTDLGAAGTIIVRLNIKDNSGNGQMDFFLDDIRLVGAIPAP
jgi:hypothetical protein